MNRLRKLILLLVAVAQQRDETPTEEGTVDKALSR
jgi:hypothetical protein